MKLNDLIWSHNFRLLKFQNLSLQIEDKLAGKGKDIDNTIKIQIILQFPN